MAKSKKVDFEKSLASLEDLVKQLEAGDLSLEDSLAAFEKGIKLTRECQQALSDAEQRVQVLVEKQGAELQLDPFNPDEDDA